MKILFWGTPEFAVPSLRALGEEGRGNVMRSPAQTVAGRCCVEDMVAFDRRPRNSLESA